jgi:ribonucleoside-triphosphate reductase
MVGEEAVIMGGQPVAAKYKDFQKEMDMFNQAFAEVMTEGDAQGRVFTFPIPTYSISKDFDWENKKLEPVWEMTRKYGVPYFSNFVNSDMDPDDARSMCCRLRIDNKILRKRGGLFAANPLTGSIGVVTINLPRIGYLAKGDRKKFFSMLGAMMDIARDSLMIKRVEVERWTQNRLYPYCRYYLEDIYKRNGTYWKNHFNTIGINGMNEAISNLIGKSIADGEGKEFAKEVMDYMREKLLIYQRETGEMFNLEATPAEGTAYRFARIDKSKYPGIICANNEDVQVKGVEPFYSNSTHLPVDYTSDIFEALDHQDELQTRYNGGTVLHGFMGESLPDTKAVKLLVKKIASNYHLPYFSITPTFSVCPKHGYLKGEWEFCPKCDSEIGYRSKQ